MQKILVHVAMVLLGMTLTVGFYEGRRLAKNTARAFTAATTMSTASTKRSARDERLGLSDPDASDAVMAAGEGPVSPGRAPQLGMTSDDLGARALRAKAPRVGEPGEGGGRRGKRGGGGRRGKRGQRGGGPGAGGFGPSELGAGAMDKMGELEARQPPPEQAPPPFDDTGAL
ncbi:MAG: hypothetical protein KC621_24160 [Myxococcales bacterium]|nr:hypothetical protein [Myxococcales bacterium]